MKNSTLFSMIIALIAFAGFDFFSSPKNESIIHNPAEPHYGQITFDLEEDLVLGSESDDRYLFYRVWDIKTDAQGNIYVLDSGANRIQKYDNNGKYLQSIGRQGQGPGEFERPIMMSLDKQDNLYVAEMAKIHTFDRGGKFVKTTTIPFFFMNFAPNSEGNFAVTGRVTSEAKQNLGVFILDADGEIRKKIAEFPGLPLHETGMTISHDYSPQIRYAAVPDLGFIYGYNMEYKLYMADWSGKNVVTFDKEEAIHSVSRTEKNKIISELLKNLSDAELGWSKSLVEKMANLPHHRPFFDRIRVDDTGRIYVRQCKSILDEGGEMDFDIFGNDGYFLYSTELPFVPTNIRDGFMYNTTYSEKTGEIKVLRYRIKNWKRMVSSMN